MCTTFVAVVLFSWMPKFLYDKFHLSLATAGLVATLFTQLASMIGAPFGGWLADRWRKRKAGGRLMVQLIGVVACTPFVVLCGESQSVLWVVIALLVWGFFRGQYEANTFAALFDVIPPVEARGTAVGLMNMSGWLVGGGTATGHHWLHCPTRGPWSSHLPGIVRLCCSQHTVHDRHCRIRAS